MNRAVFLDRDNTIIINDGDLANPNQVRLMQGAASAIASLRGLGYKIVVVTNQGGVARGKFTEAQVEATNQRIADMVKSASGGKIDKFYFCPYHPQGTVGPYAREHPWRKPQPGMILQAAADLDLDLPHCWLVGDQPRDIQAGLAAGVRTVLLRPDAEAVAPLRSDQADAARISTDQLSGATGSTTPHFTARNLIEAVRVIAQARKPEAVQELANQEARSRKSDSPSPPRNARPGTAPAAASVQPGASAYPANTSTPGTPPGGLAAVAPHSAVPAAPTFTAAAAVTPTTSPTSAATSSAMSSNTSSAAGRPLRNWNAGPDATDAIPADPAAIKSSATPPPPAPAPPATATATPDSPSPETPADPPIETTLRQILHELRHQRGQNTDFSYLRVLAIIVQVIAVFCLLAALLMNQDQNVFMRCMATGVLAQMATIALLLFSR